MRLKINKEWHILVEVRHRYVLHYHKVRYFNNSNEITYKSYIRHQLKIKEKLLELLFYLKDNLKIKNIKVAASGFAAMGIAESLDFAFVQEVFSIKVCTENFNKNVKTAVELGGENAKILLLDLPLEVKINRTRVQLSLARHLPF